MEQTQTEPIKTTLVLLRRELPHIVPRRQPPQKQMKAMIATSEIIPPKPPPTAAATVGFGPVE